MAALLATACGALVTSHTSSSGGGVTYAEQAGAPPNFIFPLLADSCESNANLCQFGNQLYLPLYWFGNHDKAVVNKGCHDPLKWCQFDLHPFFGFGDVAQPVGILAASSTQTPAITNTDLGDTP